MNTSLSQKIKKYNNCVNFSRTQLYHEKECCETKHFQIQISRIPMFGIKQKNGKKKKF